MKKRLLISDLYSYNNGGIKTGHYFALCRNYMDVLRDTFVVKVAGGPIYKTGFKKEDLVELPCETLNSEGIVKRFFHIFKNCFHLMNETSNDDIIVIQVAKPATCILALALFGRKGRNIYVIEYDTSAIAGVLKKIVFRCAKKYIKGVICPDKSIGEAYDLPYCVVSDYICTNAIDEDVIRTQEKRYDFVMVGRIEPEKGIIEAAERLAGTGKSVLIAGKAQNIIAQRLEAIADSCNNIDLRLGFVDEEDYYNYLRMGRYCILNYDEAYANRSSGVVLDAIFNGTPVLGRKCMATRFIETEGLGIVYDDINSFNFERLFSAPQYRECLTKIISFLDQNKNNRNRLVDFFYRV